MRCCVIPLITVAENPDLLARVPYVMVYRINVICAINHFCQKVCIYFVNSTLGFSKILSVMKHCFL